MRGNERLIRERWIKLPGKVDHEHDAALLESLGLDPRQLAEKWRRKVSPSCDRLTPTESDERVGLRTILRTAARVAEGATMAEQDRGTWRRWPTGV